MSDVTRTDAAPSEPGDDDHSLLSGYLDGELDAAERTDVCLLYTSPSPRD